MSPALHDAVVSLFRHRPGLAGELLREVFGVALPGGAVRVAAERADLVRPPGGPDLVVVHEAGGGGAGAAVAVVVPSAPAAPGDAGLGAWGLHRAALEERLGVPVWGLAVALDAAGARGVTRAATRWATWGERIGAGGGDALLVLGPAAVPWVTAVEAARRPELAVLAVLAHRDDEGCPEVARAALEAVSWYAPARAWRYHDLVAAHLGALARARLEALMDASDVLHPMSEFGQQWFAAGRREGEVAGRAGALLGVLLARGLAPTPGERERIRACREAATLDRWLWQAVSAGSVDHALR